MSKGIKEKHWECVERVHLSTHDRGGVPDVLCSWVACLYDLISHSSRPLWWNFLRGISERHRFYGLLLDERLANILENALEEGALWWMTSNLASNHEIGWHEHAQVRRKSFRLASINNLISCRIRLLRSISHLSIMTHDIQYTAWREKIYLMVLLTLSS